MAGKEKTYSNLEPIVLKSLETANSRDLSEVMYAYAVRSAGNPGLYESFDKRLQTEDFS